MNRTHAILALTIAVWLVSAASTYHNGGLQNLMSAGSIIVVFCTGLPLFVLWAAAKGAGGTTVPQWALIIAVIFFLLDVALYVAPISALSESDNSIVTAAMISLQIILPLLMVVSAIVSRVRQMQ